MVRRAPGAAPPALPAEALAYLEHARVQKRLAERTLQLYTQDLQRLQAAAQPLGQHITGQVPWGGVRG